ncbi:ParB/RepB/Spo0J family partition protein [Thermodesulfobacteriota bacterium]
MTNQTPAKEYETTKIQLNKISERFGHLRIVNPQADKAMLQSMEKYGQMTPVVVSRMEQGRYELLDGFKRLRASRALSLTGLNARILDLGIRAAKVAIMQLNRAGKSINGMEEALVVHSLYHEDSLSQVEIAVLLDRHKSWVCRRISLIERLSDEVKESIRLGLLPVSIGEELAKLQRSNQERLLKKIYEHHLTWRETRKIVFALQTNRDSMHADILKDPCRILQDEDSIAMPPVRILDPIARQLHQKVLDMDLHCLKAALAISTTELGQFSAREEQLLVSCCKQAISSIDQAKKELMEAVNAYETGDTQ